jgi:amino acid adenylation domain-containing protein
MTTPARGRTSGLPTGRLVHQLIAAQAAQHPNRPAVVEDSTVLTYAELDQCSARLAAHLLTVAGAGPEVRIGVCLPRGAEAVTALLGVVRSGAAPVLTDPANPAARTVDALRDAAVRAVLVGEEPGTPAAVGEAIAGAGLPAVHVSDANGQYPTGPDPVLTLESAAHIAYTSGSTGTPKGVVARHASVLQCLYWAREAFGLTEDDRLTWLSPPGFGICLMNELWPALSTGCTLYIPDTPTLLFADRLRRWLLANRVTVVQLTRTLAEPLMRLRWPADGPLRLMLVTGERMTSGPPDLPFTVAVTYGSTETTHVTSTLDQAAGPPIRQRPNDQPRVGWPVANTSVYLLDAAGRPVAGDEPGEIHVAGPGIAREYLGDPAMTAERWLPDPFPARPGDRMYRTGDVGRRLPDGSLELLGRLDRQIKVRGQRTNLDEVEVVLCAQPEVGDAAVVVHGEGDAQRLVAYLSGVDRSTVAGVHAAMAATLPSYALPSDFVLLDALPRNANGKVDRQALPEPAGRRDTSPAPLRVAADEIEYDLVELWRQLLGRDEVGVADSFFDLGGHSMIAVQMVSAIEDRYGVLIDLPQFFSHPTITDIAASLRPAGAREGGGSWLVRPHPAAYPRVTLVCFPFAGGSPVSYFAWPGLLPADVDVVCVQPPARGERLDEPPVHHLDELVDAVGKALLADEAASRPMVFFGHSVGATAAFETARWLRRRGAVQPRKLLVSGSAAPQVPVTTAAHLLLDEELWAYLRKLGGTPEELLHDLALRDLLLPALRADFEMHETYVYRTEPPLDCSITAIGGNDDPEVSTERLDQWADHTTGTFQRHQLPGGHFYLNHTQDEVLRLVRDAVRRVPGEAG